MLRSRSPPLSDGSKAVEKWGTCHVDDPRDYEPLYRQMRAVTEKARSDSGGAAEFHVFLSPGTPQMHAVWVLLAKTNFPAQLWQGSEHEGRSRAELARIPFDIDAELIEPAREQERARRTSLDGVDFVCESAAMRRVVETVLRAAKFDDPVLLLGESGVGKEALANLIHARSPTRSGGLFVAVNCGALPGELAESELFGHVQGAFTSATRDHRGLFEQASGGTLFLDEVGDLPADLQVKLLRALQEKAIRRVNDERTRPVDVRIVAATNQPLDRLRKEGRFRDDLFYRLAAVRIQIPPLRDRRADIRPLIDRFLDEANRDRVAKGESPVSLLPSVRRRLMAQPWPGNARDLRNVVRRLALMGGGEADWAELVDEGGTGGGADGLSGLDLVPRPDRPLPRILADIERTLLEEALRVHGTQGRAARALGLRSAQALQSRLAKHGR